MAGDESSVLEPSLTLTPRGHLRFAAGESGLAPARASALAAAFGRGSGHGLLELGATEVGTLLPPDLAFWRDFGARWVSGLCATPEPDDGNVTVAPPPPGDLETIAAGVPPMAGAEYCTAAVLVTLWTEIDDAFRIERGSAKTPVQAFLKRKHPAWHVVGRVHFNLAEHRRDAEAPFAFLATYTAHLSSDARARHLPLGQALTEYAGAADKPRLLSLLLPVQRAAADCGWLKAMVDAGEIYHPIRWTAAEALQMLTDVPRLEAAGVIVRVPNAWRGGRPPRPKVTATVGGKPPSGLGAAALLDFSMTVSLEGEALTATEIEQLLASTSGLQFMRGRWVEVDRDRLRVMLDQFRAVEAAARREGLTFAEAARLVAGVPAAGESVEADTQEWSRVTAGPWLAATLARLRDPAQLAAVDPGDALRATLRPYQQEGVRWLHLLTSLGLGACLADDMGLGKTMQILALLLVLRRTARPGDARCASVLVAPASLLANWADEIDRHAPGLRTLIVHPSAMRGDALRALDSAKLRDVDLVITSYGSLLRMPALLATPWRLAILDEAQAIKSPGAKQTRAAKQLDATARIALSGTPVENRAGDLWSIFDFLNPGLLGSAKAFAAFTKRLASSPSSAYAPLRTLVRPYILRRVKTDKAVIADLPDKTEVKAFCHLTRAQAALYQQAVADLAAELGRADGMQRRGIVLASLMRLKQICNHPSQWLGDGGWAEADSGKLARLRELGEVIAARQQKALVFTQFREVTAPLAAFLETVFGAPGLVLHGQTPVGKRQAIVRRFQEDEAVPFFVVSLKAGGSGLNLTAASHVVHFDRWWNPAVENQATDRAFRIGQTQPVLVHKFVCRGTVEEKVDALIDAKRQLSQDLLEGGGDVLLTEMGTDELLKTVALDLHSARAD